MADVSPTVSTLAAVYTTSGTTAAIDLEPMREVNMTAQGYPRYTVYEITAPEKRYLAREVTPTFHADSGGSGLFSPITGTIEYAGGRIILKVPRGSADVVQCMTGKYYTTITKVFGASVSKLNNGSSLVEVPLLGDAYVRRYPTLKDFDVSVDNFMVFTEAQVTTTADAVNGHLTFQHVKGGRDGNDIRVEILHGTGTAPASLNVSGTTITITLADTSGVPTSTAYDILRLVNASPECKQLGVLARLPAGSTGLGLMAPSGGALYLTGGLDANNFYALYNIPLIIMLYVDELADTRMEGYCYIETEDWTFDPKTVVSETLSFKGDGPLYYRPS